MHGRLLEPTGEQCGWLSRYTGVHYDITYLLCFLKNGKPIDLYAVKDVQGYMRTL